MEHYSISIDAALEDNAKQYVKNLKCCCGSELRIITLGTTSTLFGSVSEIKFACIRMDTEGIHIIPSLFAMIDNGEKGEKCSERQ